MPFAALIERGLVTPGAMLTDAKKRHKALVRADGAVSIGNKVGSIHRIGALAQGLDACNGWTFWHVETPKGLQADRRIARAVSLGDGGSRRIARQCRQRLVEQFQRALGESFHVLAPVGAAGFQRDRPLDRPADRDAAMARRIAVAVAGRPGRAGFAETPGRAVLFPDAPRAQQRIGFGRGPHILPCRRR